MLDLHASRQAIADVEQLAHLLLALREPRPMTVAEAHRLGHAMLAMTAVVTVALDACVGLALQAAPVPSPQGDLL